MTFGDFRLDAGTRQLYRGKAEVHLTPKAFDLLLHLADHRTRAVSKAELHERLWPATFVSEANLASLVAEVRRALGDQSREPSYIRTVHGFGYAFVGRVAGELPPESPASAWWVIAQDREVRLPDGESIIGRDQQALVRLDFPSVSRRHARLLVTADGATVEDLGSKNGTFLGGAAVVGCAPLSDLDELKVGSVTVIVRRLVGGDSTETFGI